MSNHSIDIIVAAHDRASGVLGKVGGSVQRLDGMFRSIVAGVAGYFSSRAIVGFAQDVIKEFSEEELIVNNLKSSLETIGKAEQLAGLQGFASTIEGITPIADDLIMKMETLGVGIGHLSGETLKSAVLAAIGFSKSLKIDVEQAMEMVAKAAVGHTETFKRYGIAVDDAKTTQENFSTILQAGIPHFHEAQSETDTYIGKVDQLKNAWDNLKETMGENLLDSTNLTESFDLISIWFKNTKLMVDAFVASSAISTVDIIDKGISAAKSAAKALPIYWLYRGAKNIFGPPDLTPEQEKQVGNTIFGVKVKDIRKKLEDELNDVTNRGTKKLYEETEKGKAELKRAKEAALKPDVPNIPKEEKEKKEKTMKIGRESAEPRNSPLISQFLQYAPGTWLNPQKETANNTKNVVDLLKMGIKEWENIKKLMEKFIENTRKNSVIETLFY